MLPGAHAMSLAGIAGEPNSLCTVKGSAIARPRATPKLPAEALAVPQTSSLNASVGPKPTSCSNVDPRPLSRMCHMQSLVR